MAQGGAVILAAAVVAATLAAAVPEAHAQAQIGGVSLEGEWYVGEGLSAGDYFSYNVCHISYKECKEFRFDFWIEGDRLVGNESKWIAQVAVHDGAKVAKGTMELGKVAPEPTGSSDSIKTYSSVYKSSIAWLSAFATAYGGDGGEGPKRFGAASWGKIANIGGEQILPKEVASVTVRGGTFEEAVIVSWRTGGAESRVWVVDGFPFPVQAGTWVHVSEGIPPQEYRFELLDYGTSESNPYEGVVATVVEGTAAGCPVDPELSSTKRTTAGGKYLIKASHGPEEPVAGCDMSLLLSFHSKYDETEFLNQVQYDILVADPSERVVYTASEAEGSRVLYSGSGQTRNDEMWVPDEPGEYTYAILVHGLAPSNTLTQPGELDSLQIPITIVPNDAAPTPTPPMPAAASVPPWIKSTTGFWVDGHTGDAEFVAAIEFLVREGVIAVSAGSTYAPSSGAEVPPWIKDTAGFWVDGHIDDPQFVAAIEFLVGQGIIAVS